MAAIINNVMPVTPIKPEKPDMKDEYGDMDSSGETFIIKNFQLESGEVLAEAHVCDIRCVYICIHINIAHRYAYHIM
jgi:hypothetical protein